MATKLGVDVRSIRLLLEIGVTAAYEGLPAEGESIVRGVQTFRDDVPQPGVCLIGAFFFQKRYEEAIVEAKAVQNFNVICGFDERTGLRCPARS